MKNLFLNHKVLVCAGSGGVGKTTVSASLAVAAAHSGLNVLVLTIDPARRLATSLGLESGADEVEVKGVVAKGKLFASIIDSKKEFDRFLDESTSQVDLLKKIKSNRLYEQLSTTLSGSQEFTSIIKLYKAVESNKYDLVILDTPPTQHAIDFLTAPQKIRDLFQGKITKWFIGDQDQGWLANLLNKSTQTVLMVLKKLTGSSFMEELSDFFVSLKEIEAKISERSEKAHELLLKESTAFVLITSFDQSKIFEAKNFYSTLSSGGYNVRQIVVNRAYPMWVKNEGKERAEAIEWRENHFKDIYLKVKNFYIQKAQVYDNLEQDYQERVDVAKIPEFDHDIYGVEGLKRVAKEFEIDH